jgi:hypothetical protein
VATNVDQSSILDGFIIKEGNANDSISGGAGGGILIRSTSGSTSPKIQNCTIIDNAAGVGGGLGVVADEGAQISPEIVNCDFNFNGRFTSSSSALYGGGVGVVATPNEANFSTFINCSFNSNTSYAGGAVFILSGKASFVNCTATLNKSDAAFQSAGTLIVKNSILWKNFSGNLDNPSYNNQIITGDTVNSIITNNIIQGGYGPETDNNIDADPLFKEEPSFVGKYPRTSIIPVSSTDPKYENMLSVNGSLMWGPWPYYAYKDHAYNKIYLAGRNLQVLDFSNLVDNKPTSTIFTQVSFPRTIRPERSVHNAGNRIYFASFQTGLASIDRATGQLFSHDVLAGESVTYTKQGPTDLVIDNVNNLLYCPVFYDPGRIFFGLLELNLTTQSKRWITTTSSPVSITGTVETDFANTAWGTVRMYLDDFENTLYFSTGNGVWWWNRTNNSTGLFTITGGIPLNPGNPSLPSNLTTGMYMDHVENKFYIGTHQGLFVWDRSNNTSKIYNTGNSKLKHNLVNHIDKNDELNLIYVSLEEGGLFVLNTVTGEENAIFKDAGSNTYPQFIGNSSGSAFYDETEKKLYVAEDHTSGGVWVQDYNNLVPDYGDLRLKAGSPAIDRGDNSYLPGTITADIDGSNRLVDYVNHNGNNSLDLGAYEKTYVEEDEPSPVIPDTLALNYVQVYNSLIEGIKDESTLDNYPVKDVNKSIEYIDGLGRPIQSIAIQGSPSRSAIIQPIVYDAFGREAVKYLPYVEGSSGFYRSNPIGTDSTYENSPQQSFYDNPALAIAQDGSPFSKTIFEASPLNRVLKQGAPGTDWQPAESTTPDRTIRKEYLTNAAEEVVLFIYDPVTGTISASNNNQRTYYDANELFATKTIDEHYNEVIEYSDKEGKVILKKVQYKTEGTTKLYASTYYIYDDFGNLVVVLPPEGVNKFLSVSQN